jgi:hypothetical protein
LNPRLVAASLFSYSSVSVRLSVPGFRRWRIRLKLHNQRGIDRHATSLSYPFDGLPFIAEMVQNRWIAARIRIVSGRMSLSARAPCQSKEFSLRDPDGYYVTISALSAAWIKSRADAQHGPGPHLPRPLDRDAVLLARIMKSALGTKDGHVNLAVNASSRRPTCPLVKQWNALAGVQPAALKTARSPPAPCGARCSRAYRSGCPHGNCAIER